MKHLADDTIAAIATAPGGAARGIVRVGGISAVQVVDRLFVAEGDGNLQSLRRATAVAGNLRIHPFGAAIPARVYVWPTRRSYTRQPLVEIHTIGSPPVLDAIVADVCRCGARLAAPGEFTMRAFLSGRIDLTQAEAVLGVIDAADNDQLQTALAQLAGGIARPLAAMREDLLDLLAHLEAGLDFVEEDIQFIAASELQRQVATAEGKIVALLDQLAQRSLPEGDANVVITGWPNVGKSSLFNALAQRDAAIVADAEGTTRDYVTCRAVLGGVPCEVIDTAGQTCGDMAIETSAQQLTHRQTAIAAMELFCLDAGRPMNAWEQAQITSATPRRLVVLTKSDLPQHCDYAGPAVSISNVTGQGMAELQAQIGARLHERSAAEVVPATAARCRDSLSAAAAALARAGELALRQAGDELVAAEIRAALDELGHVVGAVYTDDLLDRIFGRFCIGK